MDDSYVNECLRLVWELLNERNGWVTVVGKLSGMYFCPLEIPLMNYLS
jgi:hypothetical protein